MLLSKFSFRKEIKDFASLSALYLTYGVIMIGWKLLFEVKKMKRKPRYFHETMRTQERMRRIIDPELDQRILELLYLPEVLQQNNTVIFLHGLRNEILESGGLTEKQINALSNTEKEFSVEGLEKKAEWIQNWDQEKKERALLAAAFYKNHYEDGNPLYFQGYVEKYLDDPNYVISRLQYEKFCENKYMKRVATEVASKQLFKCGDNVIYRKNARNQTQLGEAKLGIVLRCAPKKISAAVKGGKKYYVMPITAAQPVLIEERLLKLKRRRKVE
jgi:hypothetical protein